MTRSTEGQASVPSRLLISFHLKVEGDSKCSWPPLTHRCFCSELSPPSIVNLVH